jgi:hypothetical protein
MGVQKALRKLDYLQQVCTNYLSAGVAAVRTPTCLFWLTEQARNKIIGSEPLIDYLRPNHY